MPQPIVTTAAESTISGSRDATAAINGPTDPEPVICCEPDEMADLIEYCWADANFTWGRLRIADGHPEPYRVRFVELGK
jgi:alpha-L-arabinofuranosidase